MIAEIAESLRLDDFETSFFTEKDSEAEVVKRCVQDLRTGGAGEMTNG